MVFKGPAGFQRIVFIVLNVVIGIVVTLCLTAFIQKVPITPVGVLQSAVLSFFVGYTLGDLIPSMAWGQKLAAALHVKGKLGVHLISSAVIAFFMGTFILFFCSLINLAANGMAIVMGYFAMAYLLVLGVAYVCIVIFVPLGSKLATAISGFDPAAAPDEGGQVA